MATNIKRIIYFHHRIDATSAAIRNKRSDIDMFRRDFGAPVADNWEEMSRAHGYHACARTEMREPWFPDGRLIAKAPNLLAICSLGAGYDVIDIDACTHAGILVCNQSGANKEAVGHLQRALDAIGHIARGRAHQGRSRIAYRTGSSLLCDPRIWRAGGPGGLFQGRGALRAPRRAHGYFPGSLGPMAVSVGAKRSG